MKTLPIIAIFCLSLASCNSSAVPDHWEKVTVPDNWKKVNETDFEFSLPPDMKKIPVKGIDSVAGEYKGTSIKLRFAYGWFSETLDVPKRGNFTASTVTINGLKAKIVSGMASNTQYSMAIQFPQRGDTSKVSSRLTMYSSCQSEKDFETIRKIYESVRFLKQ